MSKLYRSRTDRYISGLCGGISEKLGIDSIWIRLLVVITTFFSGGIVIPLYFLAVIVVPKEPFIAGPFGPAQGFGSPGPGAWQDNASQYAQQWGQNWGKHWGSKQGHSGWSSKHNTYDAQYSQSGYGFQGQPGASAPQSDFDEKMQDIEKKAMWKEIQELRAKLAAYEKNQQTNKGDV
ncbi:PspC domain-containing protein [Paenibacillus xerothermodurans]|uniref:PspC domain-containing protein n=1 Tax=Paenibacillus xerothermodurans TaxID=1977292 RepID=A0A2W1NBC6_PAEXE|nr:PspC domain-containing protein [Paenibacillus xerothermodurans]PZE21194.1 PspC domain-containing protein [Paenibacillus xerothermodurans]